MEINEASFPWYAGIVTTILVFRLFSEDFVAKIGISIAMIMGFFGTSIVLKLAGRTATMQGIRNACKKIGSRAAENERKEKEAGGKWAVGMAAFGMAIGAGIAEDALIRAYERLGTILPEGVIWTLVGGAVLCAIGAIIE